MDGILGESWTYDSYYLFYRFLERVCTDFKKKRDAAEGSAYYQSVGVCFLSVLVYFPSDGMWFSLDDCCNFDEYVKLYAVLWF